MLTKVPVLSTLDALFHYIFTTGIYYHYHNFSNEKTRRFWRSTNVAEFTRLVWKTEYWFPKDIHILRAGKRWWCEK